MGISFIVSGEKDTNRKSLLEDVLHNYSQENFSLLKSQINNPDIHIVTLEKEKKNIGISQVKLAIKFLQEKPFSHKNKVLIIDKADKLTVEAQNALLKTLEEPPEFALILLLTPTASALLETVQSRCRKIRQSQVEKGDSESTDLTEQKIYPTSFEKIVNMPTGERFELANELSKEDREDLINIIDKWIREGRKLLVSDITQNNAENISLLLQLKLDLEKTNVNARLGLENLFLHLL